MKINKDKATQLLILATLLMFWLTLYLQIIESWYFVPAFLITCGLAGLMIAMTTRHLLDPDHKDDELPKYNQHTDYDGE